MNKTRPKLAFTDFTILPQACKRMLADTGSHYQGWSNSATYTFSLYFLQESANHEALVKLIRSGKKITATTYLKASKLFCITYAREQMEPMDGDEEGTINVREIVDTLAAELR